jgi:hypothetical protein
MISTDYVLTMAAYNAWMNERLYGLCGGLKGTVRF